MPPRTSISRRDSTSVGLRPFQHSATASPHPALGTPKIGISEGASFNRSVVLVQMPSSILVDTTLGALLIGLAFSLTCEVTLSVFPEIDETETGCTAQHVCKFTLTFLGTPRMIGPSSNALCVVSFPSSQHLYNSMHRLRRFCKTI
jgi:hypothetical protein